MENEEQNSIANVTSGAPASRDALADVEAGRELDALIDERCFGIRRAIAGFHGAPFYSTDIAAAWQVVERLLATFPPFVLWCNAKYTIAQIWDADDNEIANERGETAPLAICRAALKAVGEK